MSYNSKRRLVKIWHWADRNRVPMVGFICHKIYWSYVVGGVDYV